MGYKEEVADRLYLAFDEMRSAASRKRESFGQKDLAERIAKIVGGDPPNQSVVSRWMAKEEPSLPDNLTLDAAAQVLGVNELWLLLGKGPMRELAAPAPAPAPAPELKAQQTLPTHGHSLPDNSQAPPSEQRRRKRARGG